ncbi:hypothetical protein [Mycolicibacterium sp. YH-1]|uniref:hypothetical protein n=1 Tax=Mycolicibacterium sp. YH-1 TaxID=2908837 RepID=UPI001F4C21DB|nr:hypothetical protein [Mycolicibacterium sp. YH-1]UNB55589.1 hypothetical protein L0M16_15505 [Mycolicibacterium sp. YH-1]
MADRTIRDDLRAGSPARRGPSSPDMRPTWWARLRAALLADRLDRELEAGVTATPGSLIAVHGARLASARERELLRAALHLVMHDALVGHPQLSARVPVQTAEVRRAADVISDILDRLDSPDPARVRGMARLRILLSDGRGPLYRAGSGSLVAALRGVLAAL